MEFGSDGGNVATSNDYGATWKTIDYTGVPGAVTFGPNANYTYVSSLDPLDPSQKGWTGDRNNWFKVEKIMRPDTATQLIIRWRFASDFSGRDEGWAIDDVCFEDLGNCTPLGLNEFAENNFGLSQNYPNPATDATTFEYIIPAEGQVAISITNVYGQKIATVVNEKMSAGSHLVELDTKNYAAGIYIYSLRFNESIISKRLVIAK
jgi:hypothetical protein